jgi:hypothetical protein
LQAGEYLANQHRAHDDMNDTVHIAGMPFEKRSISSFLLIDRFARASGGVQGPACLCGVTFGRGMPTAEHRIAVSA